MATTTTTMASLLSLEPARFLIAPSFATPAAGAGAAYHCDSKLAAVSFPSLKCRHLPSAAAIGSPAPSTPASSSSRLLTRKSVAVAVQVRRIILYYFPLSIAVSSSSSSSRPILQKSVAVAVPVCCIILYYFPLSFVEKNSKFKCEVCPVLLRFCHGLSDNVPQIRQFCEVSGRPLIRD